MSLSTGHPSKIIFSQVAPQDLVSVDSIRNAMGIALEPSTADPGIAALEPMDTDTLTSLEGDLSLGQPTQEGINSLFDDPEDTLNEFFDNPGLVDSPAMVTSTGSPGT